MADTSIRAQQRWAIPLMVLIAGTFLAVLGTSVVNVAIPYIQKDLGVSADEVRWVSTAYLLSLGIAVPLSSWLSERFGSTRLLLASLVAFTVASGLCGTAWDITSLVAFRVLQAFPGGFISVVSMTLLFRIVPPNRLGTAMGLYGLGVILAPALGPVLGGWLVEYASWHLIFFMTVPVGVVAITAAAVILPRPRPVSWPRFDWGGYAAIALGILALMIAADRGPDPEWGWTDLRVLVLAAFGLLSLALFVVIELEVAEPLIDLRVFRSRTYCVALALIAISSIGMFALLYYVPQFLITVRGYQALEAGLLLVPSALAMAVTAPLAGQLVDRFGPRWPAVIGMAVAALGSLLMARLTVDTPRDELILWTTIRNVGVGLSMMPSMSAGLSTLSGALLASGSTMSNVVLRVSSSLGVAGFGGLVSLQYSQLMADRAAMVTDGAPALTAAAQHGAGGLAPFYRQLSSVVTTTTYADAFYLLALLTAAGAGLALLLRPAAAAPPASAAPQTRTPAATNTTTATPPTVVAASMSGTTGSHERN